ncbi:DUF2541 domain-containing protein [Shewanella sp. NFH-SH190041]|uniref:DUF2541 family protein n=1 Tax=Shewanella sp. NFH-SH190041 TaxID=2950245 RepID=UPI0021C28F1E|nr:DUF2541 family protein [Shewanella sp. NFH-SH190041]BDM65578.1 DUF2541 domain-containing protein [Shewanella sp. NFH-SH190041]
MMKKTVLAMLAGVTLMGAAGVQAAENITLGRTILLEDGNHGAKIPLIVCRKTDAIKIRAERDLKLRKAVFTFQNGETRTINFYRDVKKGDSTDWRKFAYRRCVKNIEVFGEAKDGTAGLKVLGRKKD